MNKKELLKDKQKNKRVEFRLSEKQFAFVSQRASLYCNGDMSKWIRHCLFNYKAKSKQ